MSRHFGDRTLAWPLVEPPVLLEQLRGFCAERPDLWQTWSSFIEQALRMRLDQEALNAATELTTRFPLTPRAWLELARVHRAVGKHSEEVEATGRAVHLAPGWDEAAREHANVLELLGRDDEAIAVLERASGLEPLNGANHVCLADVLRRQNRHALALDGLLKSADLCPFHGGIWERVCEWSIADKRRSEAVDMVRQVSEAKGHHRSWWPIAADCWDAIGESDQALAAIQRGLELDPKHHGLRDRLAYHHFNQREYDLAIRACEALEGETEAPLNLRGRHAWILLHSGRPVEGIKAMKRLLEEQPDYAWGLGELATYYETRADWQALRDHSQAWLRATPHVLRAFACLGLAEQNLGNRTAARAAFARAHALNPAYEFVTRKLLDMQMDDGETEAAAETLASLQQYSSGPHITCDAIELEIRRGNIDEAFRIADTLVHDPGAIPNHFAWLEDFCSKQKLSSRYRNWISSAVRTPPVIAPGALANWLGTLSPDHLFTKGYKRLLREPLGKPSRIESWKVLLNHCEGDKRGSMVLKWSRKHRVELHSSGELWNAVGETFLTTHLIKAGIDWFADRESRNPDDLSAATSINLAALYDALPGNDSERLAQSRKIRTEGLEHFCNDSGLTQALRAGLALQMATDGDIGEARALIANLEEDRCGDYYSALGHGARAVVAAADGKPQAARAQLMIAMRKIGNRERLSARRHCNRMLRAVASSLPWTRGNPSRLTKAWCLANPGSALRVWVKSSGRALKVGLTAIFVIYIVARIVVLILSSR